MYVAVYYSTLLRSCNPQDPVDRTAVLATLKEAEKHSKAVTKKNGYTRFHIQRMAVKVSAPVDEKLKRMRIDSKSHTVRAFYRIKDKWIRLPLTKL